ncbi:UNVERIFIED_CONTAM: hypothetical protein Slati_1541500 [Sesamum latifolium]|uniref:Uncharacterized protein n=1 Tax=Sesamum latifolium TaxID=2727402 RepID=A0AAW2XA59_9LAMI
MRSWCIAAGSSPEEALRGEGPGERGRQKEDCAFPFLPIFLVERRTTYPSTWVLWLGKMST